MLDNYFNFPESTAITQQSHNRKARPKGFQTIDTGDESKDEMSKKLREAGLDELDDSQEDGDYVADDSDEAEDEDMDESEEFIF